MQYAATVDGPIVALAQQRMAVRESEAHAKTGRALGEAKTARDAAQQSRETMRRTVYVADMDMAQRELKRGHVAKVIDRLERHQPSGDEEDLRGFEWYYLWAACERSIMSPVISLGTGVADVTYSRDGKTLISASLGNGRITQLDAHTLEVRSTVNFNNKGIDDDQFGRISPDGQVLATILADGDIRLVDVQTGEDSRLRGHTSGVWMPAFSSDSKLFASGDEDGVVILWDMSTRQQILELRADTDRTAHDLAVCEVAFSPDSRMLATASRDETAKLWDVATGTLLRTMDVAPHTIHRSSIWSIAFSPDGKKLATGTSGDYAVFLWDIESGQLIREFRGHDVKPSRLAFSPDGTVLASAGGHIWLWDVASGEAIDSLPIPTLNHVPFVLFSPDASTLVAAHDGGAKLWQLDRHANPSVRTLPRDCVLTHPGSLVAASADGATVILGSTTGRIEVWNMSNRGDIQRFSHGAELNRLAWLGVKRQVVSVGNGSIKLWHAETGKLLKTLRLDSNGASFVDACVKARDLLFAVSSDGAVHRWDLGLTNPQRTLVHAPNPCRSLHRFVLSDDGRRSASVMTSASSQFIDIWDLTSNQSIQLIPLDRTNAELGAFSSDGSLFALNNDPHEAIVWSIVNGEEQHRLTGHEQWVSSICFSPSNSRLLTGTRQFVRMWDTDSGTLQFELEAAIGFVYCIFISADSRIVTTVASDRKIRQWRAATDDEVHEMRRRWQSTLATTARSGE